jgi:signal peptidase I
MSDNENVNSRAEKPEKQESFVHWLIETALLVLLAFALAQGIKTFVAQPFIVPTGSMLPTIELSDYLLAEKVTYRFSHPPRPGDIVVFNNPTRDPSAPILIKRLIAVGGQKVDLKDGAVYVNGKKLDEPYTHGQPSYPLNPAIKYPFVVPQGTYWMMGDNRTNSGDSREFGPVAARDIIGHAVWTYWPLSRFGELK